MPLRAGFNEMLEASMRYLAQFASVLILAIGFFVALSLRADTQNLDQRRSEFKQLLVDQWEYTLRERPELATSIGDYRYNDRWSDLSLAHVAEHRHHLAEWLAKFEAVDSSGFAEQEQLSERLMVRDLKQEIEGIDLKTYLMPIDQFNGLHLATAQVVAVMPFDTTKQYEDYLSRLRKLPTLFDQVVEVLKQGAR